MPLKDTAAIEITAFRWVPDFAPGVVRDLRVRWALEEAGLDYQVDLLGFERPASYLQDQPFDQVPVCREGPLTLFETGAIVQHIGERDERLLPREPVARARAIQWFSDSNVWVAGSVDTGVGTPASWAGLWHWNGSAWIRTLFTLPAGVDGHLWGLHGVASNDIWAVGRTFDSSFGEGHVLFLHWIGSAWSQVTISGEPTSTSFVNLYDVRMRTSADGWAVGVRDGLMLAYHWDGSAWTEVPVSY